MTREAEATRLKRLRMRSRRRGTREMDLILGPFADCALGGLSEDDNARYETLLSENDWDLYLWVSGAQAAPEAHGAIVARIRAFHHLA